MRAWWRRRSKRNKLRLILYPSIVIGTFGSLFWMTRMPGKRHEGPLPPLNAKQIELRDRLRADVVALGGERNTEKPGTLAKSAATAPFRNPNYHTPRDTPDTMDYDRLARVTSGLEAVVRKLVE